jgi:hydroxymethylglutaryl-CoA lyase
MNLPSFVQLIDVGPRDGLQNEKQPVPAAVKIELVHRLQAAGLTEIEVTSFVSPKWVPQMADNAQVMAGIQRQAGVRYSVLTPNVQGFEAALKSKPDEIVVFGAASEAFSHKNINCSIAESMERFAPVVQAALAAGIAVRGAMSCTVGCPYEGDVAPERVGYLAGLMKQIGVQRVDVADTIGVGTPLKVQRAIEATLAHFDVAHICGHFHDTPTVRPWATRWRRCRWACGTFSRPWPGWAAALMPRARPAMWPPKRWCICCTAWALTPASTWTVWWMRAHSSATFCSASPTRVWPLRC